jgi:site-specific DNA-methyltransferase (adenine-specific)
MNTLYFGDNLDVLKKHVAAESVDLIYLDPPFNSNADYSLIYKSPTGGGVESQIQAFKDMWKWEEDAAALAIDEIRQRDVQLFRIMQALQVSLGEGDMMAYLAMMAVRLLELRRVLKPAGSLYLHCDPTASHYLKVILDAIFGPVAFKNEIIWRRTGSHNSSKRFGPVHDTILFYSKGKKYTWNPVRRPYMRGHVEKAFLKQGDGYVTNYSGNILTGSGTRNGESGKLWRGFDPTAKNRHWAVPSILLEGLEKEVEGFTQHQKMDFLFDRGFITINPDDEWPRYVREVGEDDGQLASDIWAYQPYTEGTVFGTGVGIDDDVRWMGSKDSDRLGYGSRHRRRDHLPSRRARLRARHRLGEGRPERQSWDGSRPGGRGEAGRR